MNEFYGLLVQFTGGTTPCREHLLRHHSEALVDEAIQLGYIAKIRENDDGDSVYAITKSGKNKRDN